MFLKEFDLGSIRDSQSSTSLTAQELRDRILKRQTEFFRQGLQAQSRVLLNSQNRIEFFIDLLALWNLEVCVAVIDSTFQEETKKKTATSLGVSGFLEPGKELQEVPLSQAPFSLPFQAALILLTSGTTGIPRGVVHSFDSLSKKIQVLSQNIPHEEKRRTLCALPTSFGHGLICNSLFPLLTGADLFLEDRFSPFLISKLNEFCEHFQITFFSSTPAVWNLIQGLAENQMRTPLKRIHCASAPLDRKRIQYMKSWSPETRFFNVYGMTEFLGWISGSEILDDEKPSCVGTPWGVEWKLSDHETPHVLLRSEFMFKGYLDQFHETYTFREQTDSYFDSEDIGEFTGANELSLRGRSRLVINKAGLKILPEEIEFWASEMSFVSEACCIPIPDEFLGHKVGLAVVLQDSQQDRSDRCQEIQDWFHQKVAAYKVPDRIWILPDLPRTARGKLNRTSLLEILQRGESHAEK